MRKRYPTAALLLAVLRAGPASAQSRRSVQGPQLRAELQGELALKNGDYLLLALYGENVPAANGSTYDNARLLGFDLRGAGVQYEHFWNDRWSYGASLQHASNSGFKYAQPEMLLRHRSPVGPLTFGQRLGVSRTIPFGSMGRTVEREGATFANLRVDLEKLYPVGGGSFALRPRLSYEAVAHLRLLSKATDAKERTIEFTRLRVEAGCRLNDRFDFTPWFAYGTAYFSTLEQFDAMGNLVGGGRLNLVTPMVGLDARFTLFSGKTVFERRQLPTQH